MSLRSIALATALAAAVPAVALADNAPVATQVEKTVAPQATASTDASRYAQREQQDQKVADYQGGSTVVIAMSGGALVLLLFLLLII